MCATYSDFFFFFFNDTATTEIYTLSLHDALPISFTERTLSRRGRVGRRPRPSYRSEEHTSELQSHHDLECSLLLEKKKKEQSTHYTKKKKNNKKITKKKKKKK